MTVDRRTVLRGAPLAAAGLSLPGAAATAGARRGSLHDVEHVVILMQENRSFDHYFGALRGVRGFGDPRPAVLPSGDPVWAQRQDAADGGATVLPFHLDTRATAAGCIASLDHSWKGSHDRWKHWDVWLPEKGPLSMGYMTRDDLPYYYALADEFTIADAYHASIHGPTTPNRLYHFAGTSGLGVGLEAIYNVTSDGCDDNPGADMAKDSAAFGGLAWTPYAARLETAGIDWRVYQEYDNFSDNPLGYFARFRNLDRASSLYRRGRAWVPGSTSQNADASRGDHLVAAFAADVAADRLPAVSWIVAPFHMCEHPDAPPAYGQTLAARLIATLGAHPDVWRKTVFILNYDENDGFFDHVPPPLPATRAGLGASTVSLRGETYRGEPVGLGPRVPLIVVSPWTRGGWVNSQLFDHTSVLRFLEARFGVVEPNITPWRRAVCGDLTSMFDFDIGEAARRDTGWLTRLPAVDAMIARSDAACRLAPPQPLRGSRMPLQEAGSRPARALPYQLDVEPSWPANGRLALRFVNRGRAAAVFAVAGAAQDGSARYYTVGAGRDLVDDWPVSPDTDYALIVSGPDGFHRAYRGTGGDRRVEARIDTHGPSSALHVRVTNHAERAVSVLLEPVRSAAGTPRRIELHAGGTQIVSFPLREGHRWYDLAMRVDDRPGYERRLAGHLPGAGPDRSEPIDGIDQDGAWA